MTRTFAVVTSLGAGRTLVTLAPEKVPPRAIIASGEVGGDRFGRPYRRQPAQSLRAARGSGLTGFTHLFNAMSPLSSRDPGPIGAALDDPEAWCGLIVDLVHVDAVNLRFAIAARGWERMILVSDAMPTVGSRTRRSSSSAAATVVRSNGRLTNEGRNARRLGPRHGDRRP